MISISEIKGGCKRKGEQGGIMNEQTVFLHIYPRLKECDGGQSVQLTACLAVSIY